jgi:hypothetical protein
MSVSSLSQQQERIGIELPQIHQSSRMTIKPPASTAQRIRHTFQNSEKRKKEETRGIKRKEVSEREKSTKNAF